MSEHTPGPWNNDGGIRVRGNAAGHLYNIAVICSVPPHLSDASIETELANAHLIAAAPETIIQRDALLAACKAARGNQEKQGLADLGIALRNNELDYSDGPGVLKLGAKIGAINRQLDAAIAGVKE